MIDLDAIEKRAKRAMQGNGVTLDDLLEKDIPKLINCIRDLAEALKYYSEKKDWEEFITSGGIFDYQEGDPLMAFNCTDDTPWRIAKETIKRWNLQ